MVMGIWTDELFECFTFETASAFNPEDSLEQTVGNRDAFSVEMRSIVAPRAITLMLVPQLTVVSLYAMSVAGDPLFITSNSCRGMLHTLYVNREHTIELSRQREKRTGGYTTDARERGVHWIVYLRSFQVYAESSRIVRHLVNTVYVLISIGFMYANVKLVIDITMLLLFPYIFFTSLEVVVQVGKILSIEDKDFRDFGIPVRKHVRAETEGAST